jgi:hypothetical protein
MSVSQASVGIFTQSSQNWKLIMLDDGATTDVTGDAIEPDCRAVGAKNLLAATSSQMINTALSRLLEWLCLAFAGVQVIQSD